MTQTPAATTTITTATFNGTWEAESSENMDEYLDKSEGVSWIVRKAASVAGETNQLLYEPKERVIRIRVDITGRSAFEYQLTLDGKTPVEYLDMDKKKIKATGTISENGLLLREEQERIESGERRWMTRELKDGKMICTFMNEIKKISMKRIFKKKSDESGLRII